MRRSRPLARCALTGSVLLSGSALLGGCQSLKAELERTLYAEYLELRFDQLSDLVAPEGLRVTSTSDRAIALAWEPVLVGDVAGYAITRSDAFSRDFVLVGRSTSRFESLYIDQGTGPERLGDGQTYIYRIRPYDSLGQVSRRHAEVTAITDPRPVAPSGLHAYSNLPRKVVLAWDPSPSPEVTGYTIYRSPSAAGEFESVGFAAGRLRTLWEESVSGDLRVLYYRIDAINRFGGESDTTEAVQAVTKADPLPPIDLRVVQRTLGRIQLGWTANAESDIRRYEVWRERPDEERPERTRIGSVPVNELRFTDSGVGCGERVRYWLRAIDRDELVSSFSEPLEASGQDLALELAGAPAGPELRWDAERLERWPGVRIVEQRAVLPSRTLAIVRDAARYPLGALGDGHHRLQVIPTFEGDEPRGGTPAESDSQVRAGASPAPGPGRAGAPIPTDELPADAPPCPIEVRLPRTPDPS